jgi:hypothetical protein
VRLRPPPSLSPPVEDVMEVDVGEQRGCDSPNAIANFEFDVALNYRRGERLFSKPRQRSTTQCDIKSSI